MSIAVHVTHEAIHKIGGIGAVIRGLACTARYQRCFPRTLLYTPLFEYDGPLSIRLGDDAQVLYSGLDGHDAGGWRERFAPIEERFGVQIVYGTKTLYPLQGRVSGAAVEILAVDLRAMDPKAAATFAFELWEHFGIESDRYAHDRDYEQYLRLGVCAPDVIAALFGTEPVVLFSHEYMGMGSALALVRERRLGRRQRDHTVFYAHEVSTVRAIVEKIPGHDIAFYNLLRADRDEGTSLEDEFGSFAHFSRNELVKSATHLDAFFAVSDLIREEFLYLCPGADANRIHVVPNGISVPTADFTEKQAAIAKKKKPVKKQTVAKKVTATKAGAKKTASRKPTRPATTKKKCRPTLSAEEIAERTRARAFEIFCSRSDGGTALGDWLEAERQIQRELKRRTPIA